MLLTQALGQAVQKNPGHPAIFDLGKPLTYAQLRNRVSQLSYLFQTELPYGERVAFLAQNSTAVAQSFFALSNAGNPTIFLDPNDDNEDILLDLKNLSIKHVLVSPDQVPRVNQLIRDFHLNLTVIEIEKKRGGEYDTSFTAPPDKPLKETDHVLILRLERSRSIRKYAFFSHKQVYQSTISARRFYRLTPADRVLTTMKWAHPFALTHGLLLPLFTGATCVVDPITASVQEFVEFIATEHVSRFVGPPKFFTQLLTYCAAQKFPLPGVKSVTVGINSLSIAVRKTFKLLNIPVMRCYGRAEAVWTVAMDEIEHALDVQNSKCRPAAGVKVKVLNEEGDEIAGDGLREGPLAVMCEPVMGGYFHPDKESAAAATRQRVRGTWLYTEEIARLEGEGENVSVAVLGRATDMIPSVHGYLSPRNIDQAASAIPGVTEAAGFVILSQSGQRSFACAVVVESRQISEKDVLAALETKLTAELRPTAVFVVESLPKDEFGSVNRGALQRDFSSLSR